MAEGSITKHKAANGQVTWRVRLEGGIDPVTGKRKRPMKTFKTRKEAEAGRAQWSTEIERGTAVDPSKMTLADWLVRWLHDFAENRNRSTTVECYDSLIASRIIPSIGAIPLQQLKPVHLQTFYSDQLQSKKLGRHTGTLSPRMVRLMHAVLHKALKDAERMGLVSINVASKVSPPRVPKPVMQAWTDVDYRAFLQTVGSDYYGPIWLLALATGMRQGELLALRWANFDTGKGCIEVRETLINVKGNLAFSEPKTAGSRRTVKLDAWCLDALREWRLKLKERQLAAPSWQNHDLLFPNDHGSPIQPRNLVRHFDQLQARAGVPRIRFHDLRHTSASVAIQSGIDVKVVSERLGHSGVQITYDTYIHIAPKTHTEAAELIGRAFSG